MSSQDETLNRIKLVVDGAGLDSAIYPADEVCAEARLVIFTGVDRGGRANHLEITAELVELAQELTLGRSPDYTRIQFETTYPFVVKDSALVEVAQFLHFLNLEVEMPGFCLDFLENKIVYRYVFVGSVDPLPDRIIESVVGVILFLLDLFAVPLERLSQGEATFLSLLEETQKREEENRI